ncbi:RNA polymerase sigma24 factor [Microlunatus endophyticus]|uniref:RNA polymerase sigma24 factor n=1 Tax=Microlunatus endophyticus TaxID=1716077 RepID=A0A917SE79_9ACTN|nr:DUF6596 domain-containing protein [Microlunatus endophyticus]GGL72018.1 RNA polymerase sigma24 factor [Microlunatus endophyticus]
MTGHGAPTGAMTAALRHAIPRAVAVVARRWGDFDDAEDAVQEAALAAAARWAQDGLPDHPVGWLVSVAARRRIDALRSDAARLEREIGWVTRASTGLEVIDRDDTLTVFLMCCHPALDRAGQVALTLRAAGGLTTREIARGLMLRETTAAQRISRSKATIRRAGAGFSLPDADQLEGRVHSVLDVLGLIHTESHSATEGEEIVRPGLAAEALRIARELLGQTPAEAPWRGEVLGLIALMLMTNAREPARIDAGHLLVPLAEQDRSLWRADLIAEGDRMLREAITRYPIGVFQIRAAIAAAHSTARSYASTDWREILGLYDLLRLLSPGPLTELARLVAWAEVHGTDEALDDLDRIADGAPAARVAAVRAHLLQRCGRDPSEALRAAAAATTNLAERRWFEARADDLMPGPS